jgi:hypothetical protein
MIDAPPFRAGDLVRPSGLEGWAYVGLSGRPDDVSAVRRYRKGHWVLELRARSNVGLATKVVGIRTIAEDDDWWAAERERRTGPAKGSSGD